MPAKFPPAPIAQKIDSASVALTALSGQADSVPPATALSGGFRTALGKKPAWFHGSDPGKTAADLARLAKSATPGALVKAAPARHPHIGPRMGHK